MGKSGAKRSPGEGREPDGNKNAMKHGFYSKIMTDTEKLDMDEAEGIEGLDGELALLRVKLCQLLQNNPDRVDLNIKTVDMIARLSRTQHAITPKDKEKLKNAIGNGLTEVAISLGLKSIF